MRLNTLAHLDGSHLGAMSLDDTDLFVQLLLSKEEIMTVGEVRAKLGADATMFELAVLLKRLEVADAEQRYSLQAIFMATALAPNVAGVVMWAYTLFEESKRDGIVTMERLAKLFPVGFPTEE